MASETPPDSVVEAVEVLLQTEEQQLYEQLGLRSRLVEDDFSISGSITPGLREVDDELVSREDLAELGRRIFTEINVAAWQLLCGEEEADTEERKKLLGAFNVGQTSVAAYLTVGLIGIGVSPFFAPVVAALAVKLFFKPTYQATCEFWKERL
jgi:hypothetical protein